MKSLIIYDLDGTLVDTREDLVRAVNHVVQTLNTTPLSREEALRCVGRGLRYLIASCVKTDDPVLIERGVAVFRTYYAAHLVDHSQLYPGAEEVLAYFADRTQAIITNKPNPYAHNLLTAVGIRNRFVELITEDAGFPQKPDPTAVRALMEKYQISSEDALLIGDSPIDIELGRRAGVLTVVITHGFVNEAELAASNLDAMVGDFHEFLKLAKQHHW